MVRVEQPPQPGPIELRSVRAGVRLTPGVGPPLTSPDHLRESSTGQRWQLKRGSSFLWFSSLLPRTEIS